MTGAQRCSSELADLRRDVIELREWKAAIISKCKQSDGFDALAWAGDKEGWGFVHYFIGHLETRALHAETILAEQSSPSPQAQAGETNTDAEPSRCKNPVARGESTETDALTGDAPVASVSTLHAVAQRPTEPIERTYLRGWNEGIECAAELLDAEGSGTPAEKIRTLIDPPPAALPAGEAEGIQWRRVNDEPYEYAVQQGQHGDEFVKLLNGSCLCRTLVIPSTDGGGGK